MPAIPPVVAQPEPLQEFPGRPFDRFRTAAFVAEMSKTFGVGQTQQGITKSGIVAIAEERVPARAMGLRRDMAALSMDDLDHASTVPGAVPVRGYDRGLAKMQSAAKYLCIKSTLSGQAAPILQPSEERDGDAGMIVESRMTRSDSMAPGGARYIARKIDAEILKSSDFPNA
ncbi:hypothetical protein AL036_15015 [Salipiger aestuarii]|uniref:amidohydrolase n=1 Tax=Salipiger aestuarii TaxID=568098 RepID=UPI00123A4FDE|nr:amidohydrolase [Salipiger aestuarii]KAA8606311.1 hypothetical protein AL036_15015 [Salipiger aestuarii]